jgi:hypothetical protein
MLHEIAKIKIGEKNEQGRPSKLDKMKIVYPTTYEKGLKRKDKNFVEHPFFIGGVDYLEALLPPVDDINTIFEVSFIGFGKWNGFSNVMAKAKPGDSHATIVPIDGSQALPTTEPITQNMIKALKMETTGNLKIQIPGVCGTGQVVTYKTTSEHGIKIINESLWNLAKVTKGKLANLPININLLKKETSFISNGQKRNTGVSYIDIGGPTIFKLQEYLSLREKINSNIINTFSNFFERENESNNNKNNEQNKDGNPDFSLVLKEKLTNLIDFKLIDNEQANSIYSNIANNNDMEKFEILNNIDVNKKEESISILNNYILI